jgi:hypothetical protein
VARKRQIEAGGLHQVARETAGVSQLAQQHVDADAAPWQGADDPARPTADVEHAAFAGDQFGDVPVPLALPVALERDDAVVRACVVVGGEDRVADLPQRPERPRIGKPEPEHAGVRASMAAWRIGEGDFLHAPAVGVGGQQDLLKDVEIAGLKQPVPEHAGVVQPEAARHVADLQTEPRLNTALSARLRT